MKLKINKRNSIKCNVSLISFPCFYIEKNLLDRNKYQSSYMNTQHRCNLEFVFCNVCRLGLYRMFQYFLFQKIEMSSLSNLIRQNPMDTKGHSSFPFLIHLKTSRNGHFSNSNIAAPNSCGIKIQIPFDQHTFY